MKYDYLIVGAGIYGAVFARQMTSIGAKCLVVDRRNHIGGNCYTNIISMHTLNSILPEKVDFINIDVEGQSAYLATLIDYDKLQTKVVCIEHDNQIDMLITHMNKFNFIPHASNHTNIIFKR